MVFFQANSTTLVQGWTSIFPEFSAVDFVSFYVEIPVMVVMYVSWLITKGATGSAGVGSDAPTLELASETTPLLCIGTRRRGIDLRAAFDIVDLNTVDLHQDEYADLDEDEAEDNERKQRLRGRYGLLWRLFYYVA